jgi:hypothetical protein
MAGYGYGISVSGSRTPVVAGGGSISPIPFSGLALWLKADTGVTKLSYNYISQIIISGTSNPNVNGTYTATTVPTFNYNSNIVNNYNLTSTNGYTITWDFNEEKFIIEMAYGAQFNSNDGINWSITNSFLNQVVISGFTGDYVGANGDYNYSPDFNALIKGSEEYIIEGVELKSLTTFEVLATNTNPNYSGAWTLVNGTGSPTTSSVTIIPSGSISGNITTSTANSDYVTEWADQSGNGRNAVQGDQNLPSTDTISGKLFLSFDGGATMENSGTYIWNDVPFIGTIICVSRFPYSASYDAGSNIFFTAPSLRLGRGENNQTNTISLTTDDISYINSSTDIDNNTNYIIGATFNESSVAIYSNGNLVGSGATAPEETGYGTYRIGTYDPQKIAEMIVYDRVLTTQERQQVDQYLNSKYQIYAWRITISGAGTTTSNGEYAWDGVTLEAGKPKYISTNGNYIYWGTPYWSIWDYELERATYISYDNLTSWEIDDASEPSPSATLSYTP